MRGSKFSDLLRTIQQGIGVCCTLVVVIGLLASCSFTRTQATPEPFNAPNYQPGVTGV